MTHLSTNYGSKLGGQVVRIFTPNAELGGNGTNSTYSAARCFIGGKCTKMVYRLTSLLFSR